MSSEAEVQQNLRALGPADDPALLYELTAAIGADLDVTWPSGHAGHHG